MPNEWDVVKTEPEAAAPAVGDWSVLKTEPEVAPVQTSVHPMLAGLPQPAQAVQQAELNAQQVTGMLTRAGEQMHQSAIPHELRGYTPQELQQPGNFQNPRTGQKSTVGGDLARVPVFDSTTEGSKQMLDGAGQVATGLTEPSASDGHSMGMYGVPLPAPPMNPTIAGGAADVAGGAMEVGTPLAAGGIVAAPLPTIAALGTGMLAQSGTEAVLKKAGVPEGYAKLGGTVAGLVGGGLAAHFAGKFGPQPSIDPDQIRPAERVPVGNRVTGDVPPTDDALAKKQPVGYRQTNGKASGWNVAKTEPIPAAKPGPTEPGKAESRTIDLQPDQYSGEAMNKPEESAARPMPPAEQAETPQAEAPLPDRPAKTQPAYGKSVNVKVAGGESSYPGRYTVREMDDYQSSHNPQSFEKNPQYDYDNDRDYSNTENAARVADYSSPDKYDPAYPLTPSQTAEQGPWISDHRGNLLSGNNRFMATSRVYDRDPEADGYRGQLADRASEYGIDPAELGRFKKPGLGIEMQGQPTKSQAQRAITDFNKTASAKLSPEEQAVADGRRLSPRTLKDIAANLDYSGNDSTMSQALSGDNGTAILNGMVHDGVLTAQERNGLIDDRDQLTGGAKDRIGKALVGRLFDSSRHFSQTPPSLRSSLERIAPQVLRVEDRPEWALTHSVREALGILADAKGHRLKNLDDLAKQPDTDGHFPSYSPDAMAIAKTLQRSPTEAQRAFRQYANDSQLSREGSQVQFFEPPTRAEAFGSAFGVSTRENDGAAQQPTNKGENNDYRNTVSVDGERVTGGSGQGQKGQGVKSDAPAEKESAGSKPAGQPAPAVDAGAADTNAPEKEVSPAPAPKEAPKLPEPAAKPAAEWQKVLDKAKEYARANPQASVGDIHKAFGLTVREANRAIKDAWKDVPVAEEPEAQPPEKAPHPEPAGMPPIVDERLEKTHSQLATNAAGHIAERLKELERHRESNGNGTPAEKVIRHILDKRVTEGRELQAKLKHASDESMRELRKQISHAQEVIKAPASTAPAPQKAQNESERQDTELLQASAAKFASVLDRDEGLLKSIGASPEGDAVEGRIENAIKQANENLKNKQLASKDAQADMRALIQRAEGILKAYAKSIAPPAGAGNADPKEASALHPGISKLVSAIKDRLARGEAIGKNTGDLIQLAKKYAGGDVVSGSYSMNELYDAMQTAVNQHIASDIGAGLLKDDPRVALDKLDKLLALLPTQTVRSTEQKELQQFSTPPTLSYVAARVANIKTGESVVEPSAGTGSLAAFAKASGAKVDTNELSPRRRELLEMSGYKPTGHNAEHIRDMRPDLAPDVVLMNPPFSSDAGRTGKNRNAIGFQHVLSALDTLPKGGRLVAILGRGASFEFPTSGPFFKSVAERGAIVRANIGLSGELYKKYGTNFDNRLLVIDKRPAIFQGEPPITGEFTNLADAAKALEYVRNTRPAVARTAATVPAPAVTDTRGGGAPVDAGANGSGKIGAGQLPASGSGDAGRRAGNRPEQSAKAANQPASARNAGEAVPAKPAPKLDRPGGELATGDSGSNKPAGGLQLETGKASHNDLAETGTFQTYRPAKLRTGVSHGKATGTDLVESSAMASVDPPDITYKPDLPKDVLDSGHITDAQLEAVVYAGQSGDQKLPSGQRAGFMIGDGTGVGKGTEASGIVLDNWNHGRKRTLWLSLKPGLIKQAQRDLDWVKAGIQVKQLNDWQYGDPIDHEGVVFVSYNTLHRESPIKGKGSRLDQIEKWGPHVIIMDESHAAKNASGRAEGDEEEDYDNDGADGGGFLGQAPVASKAGTAVQELDKRLPDGRIVYMSATGFTDTRNLAYAGRLGLWGPGTSFKNFQDFNVQIDRGGLAAMELVAKELKANGRYVARQISFKGVQYREREAPLTAGQHAMYDASVDAWQTILKNLDKVIDAVAGAAEDKNSRSRARAKMNALSQFWSTNQRFYRNIITAMKVPAVIEEIENAVNDNKSVFLDLVSTGEAEQTRQLSKATESGSALEDMDMSAKQMIVNYLEKCLPTGMMEDFKNPDTGLVTSRPVLDADGNHVQSQEALRIRADMLANLDKIQLPMAPIDQIIDYFGPEKVAEVSGRKSRLAIDRETGKATEVQRVKPKGAAARDVNDWERQQFQSGKKRIAIASGAGGTGFDFHADKRAENQQRRVHIILEPSFSADTQMQKLGRTHRTNQAQPPEYVLVASDLGGEKRFLSAIASRMASLGALTRGERKAGGGAGDLLAKYNVEGQYGTAAVQSWFKGLLGSERTITQNDVTVRLAEPPPELKNSALRLMHLMGAVRETKDGPQVNTDMPVKQFLNRVLNLPTSVQKQAFELFMSNFEQIVNSVKDAGAYDEGTTELKTRNARVVKSDSFNVQGTKTPTTHLTIEGEHDVDKRTWADAAAHAQGGNNADAPDGSGVAGVWKNKRTGKLWAARRSTTDITDEKSGVTIPAATLVGTEHGQSQKLAVSRMNDLYERVPHTKAQSTWQEALAQLPNERTEQHHLITGSVLPVWRQLSAANNNWKMRVASVADENGKRHTGIQIPPEHIGMLRQSLSGEGEYAPAMVMQRLKQGEKIDLRGATIAASRVMNAPAIVISAGTKAARARLNELGVPHYETAAAIKHYLPLPEGGDEAALKKLTEVLAALPPVMKDGKVPIDASMRPVTQVKPLENVPGYAPHASIERHLEDARTEPIKLNGADNERVVAVQANASTFEVLARAAVHSNAAKDFGMDMDGMHVGGDHVAVLGRLLTALLKRARVSMLSPDMQDVIRSLAQAANAGKSFVVIRNGTPAVMRDALEEELNHAVQAKATGLTGNDSHLSPHASSFLERPGSIGKKAYRYLVEHGGYAHVAGKLGQASAEVGVRLMSPDRYRELGLNVREARALAAQYVRTLRSAHGHKSARQIANFVFDAFGRRSDGQPGTISQGIRQRGGRGAGEVARSSVSADDGEGSVHGQERPEPRSNASLFSGSEAKEVAESSASDRAKLEGQRLTAQFGSPLTREEQLGKLKRTKAKAQQDLFGASADKGSSQGTLFSRRAKGDGTTTHPALDFSLMRKGEEDEGKVNYSGLGSLEDLTTRNLSQLRRASPQAWKAAVQLAASKSEASVVIRTAVPTIEQALKGEHTFADFRRTLIESRLQGLQKRWADMADFAQRASDSNLAKSMDRLIPLLQHMRQGKLFGDDGLGKSAAALGQTLADNAGGEPSQVRLDLGDTAASLAQKQDYDLLRKMLADTFQRAAASVTHIMPRSEFDAMRHSPSFQAGLLVYKKLMEAPMAESHGSNEGVFSDALGPLDTYYPLVPVREEEVKRLRTASKQEYSKPRNILNNFATGLSDDYDASMDAFRDRMTQAVKANNKAAVMEALKVQGLVVPLKPFETAGDVIHYRGQDYQAVKMETTPARVIVKNGKSSSLPAHAVLVPKWLDSELRPLIQNRYSAPSLGLVHKIINLANEVAISGPADFVWHSSNLFGTLVANTPFLGTSLLGKAASVPVIKRFAAIAKVLATDPTTEQAAGELQEMAKLGMLPDRFASETYSRKFSEQTGAKLRRLTAGPMLFGPKGIDVRARLVMYRLAKQINPSSSGAELHLFVNQLGNYVDSMQSQMERGAKHVGLSPFATAGSTMLRNGINAWLGTGPMPKSGASLRIWQQLTGGAVATIALWAIAHKAYTGNYPWNDKRAKLLQIPVNPADRKSKLGQSLWGKGPETGYLNFSFFNPLVGRGARALGVKGAVDAAANGGKWWQLFEAAQRDVMNSLAHPWLGPIPRAAFVGLTGDEPYLTGLRDESARLNPQLMPAVKKAGEGGSIAKRGAAAAKELNSFFGNVAANSGMGETNPRDTTDRWERMIVDLVMPGLVANGQNPGMQRARVIRQAAAARRQR